MVLDWIEWLITSPVFMIAMLAIVIAGLSYTTIRDLRHERRFRRFMRKNGFRPTVESTMWLARLVEQTSALDFSGWWEGVFVTVHRPRRAAPVYTLTFDRDLVPGHDYRVSLGAWTSPPPPELLSSVNLTASGKQLILHTGASNPARYLSAAVAYAKALGAGQVDAAR